MDIQDQYKMRSQYEDVRCDRTKLPPWDELGSDLVFALFDAYEAGARDAWRAAKQPEQSKDQQAAPDALGCPMGSTPQREALFRRMFGSVVRDLVPPDGVEEDLFKGIHQHTARMAIADLAASLLTLAIEDVDELDDSVWAALVDFPTSEYSRKEKPVILPPGCAMLATKPWATGSLTMAKTTGIERVACLSAATDGVPTATMRSGPRPTNSAA
jgi:hypothetical protein